MKNLINALNIHINNHAIKICCIHLSAVKILEDEYTYLPTKLSGVYYPWCKNYYDISNKFKFKFKSTRSPLLKELKVNSKRYLMVFDKSRPCGFCVIENNTYAIFSFFENDVEVIIYKGDINPFDMIDILSKDEYNWIAQDIRKSIDGRLFKIVRPSNVTSIKVRKPIANHEGKK